MSKPSLRPVLGPNPQERSWFWCECGALVVAAEVVNSQRPVHSSGVAAAAAAVASTKRHSTPISFPRLLPSQSALAAQEAQLLQTMRLREMLAQRGETPRSGTLLYVVAV